jgi:hypothetical protein
MLNGEPKPKKMCVTFTRFIDHTKDSRTLKSKNLKSTARSTIACAPCGYIFRTDQVYTIAS